MSHKKTLHASSHDNFLMNVLRDIKTILENNTKNIYSFNLWELNTQITTETLKNKWLLK